MRALGMHACGIVPRFRVVGVTARRGGIPLIGAPVLRPGSDRDLGEASMERGRAVIVAVIIALALALGIGVSFAPPPVEAWVSAVMLAIVLVVGAAALAARAGIAWIAGSRIVAGMFALIAFLQALLAIPAIQACIALIGS